MVFNSEGQIFLNVYHGVYKSIDGGNSWVDFSEGLYNWTYNIISMEVDSNDKVYVGTEGGSVWRTYKPTTESESFIDEDTSPYEACTIFYSSNDKRLKIDFMKQQNNLELIVCDLSGKVIDRQKFEMVVSVDRVLRLTSGLFVVKLKSEDLLVIRKIYVN